MVGEDVWLLGVLSIVGDATSRVTKASFTIIAVGEREKVGVPSNTNGPTGVGVSVEDSISAGVKVGEATPRGVGVVY